mmetsp:Transcript_30606/g.78058  ORF Transcript_30606/g.78058 Transcript_30606/m.78058 type:complete len:218 (+) Transcript_30606:543-1196(+)
MVALVPSKPEVRLTRMAYHLWVAKCASSASSAAVAYRSPSSSSSRSCALPAAPAVAPATCASSLQMRARRHWTSAPPTLSCASSSACASSKRCSAYLWSALCSACLRASSTAPALSGSLAVRGAAGEGGTEAIDRCSCSAEAVARSVSELAAADGPQLGGPPCCMVTHDHLLAASASETPPPETPPPSAVAGLGSAGFLGVVPADCGSSSSSSVAVS